MKTMSNILNTKIVQLIIYYPATLKQYNKKYQGFDWCLDLNKKSWKL